METDTVKNRATVAHLPGAERQARPDVERLRDRLNDDRGNWTKIASEEGADVSYHTLIRFANNEVKKPWGAFLRRIADYYARVDANQPKAVTN